jgi:hypothetical protein
MNAVEVGEVGRALSEARLGQIFVEHRGRDWVKAVLVGEIGALTPETGSSAIPAAGCIYSSAA